MRDHIILCGLGKVGYSVLEILHGLGEIVVVVAREIDPDWARRAESMAHKLIRGDARDEGLLREAGVARAKAVIAATNEDLANLEIALDARRLGPQAAVVLRLYDEELAERVRRDMQVRAVLNAAELSAPAFVAAALGDRILRAFEIEGSFLNVLSIRIREGSPYAEHTLGEMAESLNVAPIAVTTRDGAQTIAPSLDAEMVVGDEVIAAASHPALSALQHDARHRFAFSHAHGDTRAVRRTWQRPSLAPLAIFARVWRNSSQQMKWAIAAVQLLVLTSVLVFHFARGLSWLDALYFTITIITTVGFGDIDLLTAPPALKLFGCFMMVSGAALLVIFYSIITDYIVSQRMEQVLGPPRTKLAGHIVVVGLGNVGRRIAARLHDLGEAVLAVEKRSRADIPGALDADIPILTGDASQPQMAEQAGFDRALAVVAVTDDDMVNLRIAQYAERLNPSIRTIVRFFHSSLASKLGPSLLGIDQALNPSQAAGATFAACALATGVLQGFVLSGRLLMLRSREAAAHPACVGRSVRSLREQEGILVLMRRPADSGAPIDARPADLIAEGDRLIVLEEHRSVQSEIGSRVVVSAAVPASPGREEALEPERRQG